MAKYKKEKIKYNSNRPILSDILPYELPIIFSNRYFYRFISKHNINIVLKDNGKFIITHNDNLSNAQKEIIKLLFNTKDINSLNLITIPYNFKILHKEDDFRELTIIHPINQLFLVWFYNEFKESIKYHCSISQFSIRKPHKVAKYKIRKDSLFDKLKAKNENHEIIEESGQEYENLKTFFTYKKYSNIHKFFESYQYQRAEKKFNAMFKFDVSKCFDSIYTHSISWAILNKNIVKESIAKSNTNDTFSDIFDRFMQNLNYNETNGIVIGPEFSRIFAEMILQKIDSNVYSELRKKEIYHKRDYEIFRYVDDIFVFYNNENVKNKIFTSYKLNMKEYKLYINDSKTLFYGKPIITELTIAKEKISKLLEKDLTLKIENSDEKIVFNSYLNSQKLITKFKTIIKETNIKYKDILNWTFAIIDRKIKIANVKFINLEDKLAYEDKFTNYLLEVLDFSFFIYAVHPRTNTTIKISSIINTIIDTLKKHKILSFENKHLVYKKISDEIIFILEKYNLKQHTQIETSYLLLALSEMGKYYKLNEYRLYKYFHLKNKSIQLDYLSIMILLYYIKNIQRYRNIKRYIKIHILRLFEKNKGNINKNTETILLLFDTISCPFLEDSFKRKILKNYFNITNNSLQDKIIKEEENWFIKWQNLNYKKELNSKKSMEVYT